MDNALSRALRADGKGWVYGNLIYSEQQYFIFDGESMNDTPIKLGGQSLGACYEVIPETVGQYTGRKDINGVRIFEGDKILHGESERFIEYRGTSFYATRLSKSDTILLSFCEFPNVIGKIHESDGTNLQ